MTERLAADDFNQLWRYFEHTAVRLETLPVYTVNDERETVEEFLAGRPRPVTLYPFYARWLDQIRAVTTAGRSVERVRILDDPPTDYQRWEMWSGQYNIAAGEKIRYLNRADAVRVGVPDTGDWWLFDASHLASMMFDPVGRPLGGTVTRDPGVVARHLAWWNLALQHSHPAEHYAQLSGPSLADDTPPGPITP